nr:MAG TPA: hypothetical protein [Caudoviricetes sp.]
MPLVSPIFIVTICYSIQYEIFDFIANLYISFCPLYFRDNHLIPSI